MHQEPELTLRQVAMLADNQSARAMAAVGDLQSRYNDLVEDDRTVFGEVARLRALVDKLADALGAVADELDSLKAAAGLA